MPTALFTVLVFLFCSGLYLFLAGSVSESELIAAFPVALACAAAALLLRLREERRLHLPIPPLRAVSRLPAALFLDTVRAGAALLRVIARRPAGPVGTTSPQRFHAGGDQPVAAGRRALVTLGASLAPNGYVLTLADGLVLHHLAAAEPSHDAEWPV